jgi:RNA polymerase sigma-70 factor (ECF subfamily)
VPHGLQQAAALWPDCGGPSAGRLAGLTSRVQAGPDMAQDEQQLLEQARGGDRQAMSDLMQRYQDTIYRFGRSLCGTGDDAQDVLQDTLVTLFQRIGDFRGESSFRTWLYAIARSQCSRRRRKVHRESLPGDESIAMQQLSDSAPSAADLLSAAADRNVVQDAIDRLPELYREVLVLRDIEGLTAPEVGAALELTVEAVKSRLHRARAKVRESLEEYVKAEPLGPVSGRCPDVVAMLSRRLEGDLTGEDCASLQAHVDSCPACGRACESLRSVLVTCRRVGDSPAPPQVRDAMQGILLQLIAQP